MHSPHCRRSVFTTAGSLQKLLGALLQTYWLLEGRFPLWIQSHYLQAGIRFWVSNGRCYWLVFTLMSVLNGERPKQRRSLVQNKEQNQPDDGVLVAEPEEPPVETLPSNCSVNIRGWGNKNEAEAREFGRVVMSLAKKLSRYLDLSRLKSVVIGWDYAEVLASVDHGDGIPPAAPTANEYEQGRRHGPPHDPQRRDMERRRDLDRIGAAAKPDGSPRAQASATNLCP